MKNPLTGSIAKNVFLVTLGGILPILGVILISGLELRKSELAQSEAEARRLVQYFSLQQERVTLGIKQLLSTLALIPQVRELDPEFCTTLFRKILKENPNHANIALLTPDFDVVASGRPFTQAYFAQMKHVTEAKRTGEFSSGEYSLGGASRLPVLPFALPVIDEQGKVRAILSTSLDLNLYESLFQKSGLPEGSFIGITDHHGIRLLHYPPKDTNPIGKKIAPYNWEQVEKAEVSAVTITEGADGIRRIYYHQRLRHHPDAPPYINIHIGIPISHSMKKADAITQQFLLWLTLAAMMSFGMAWFVAKYGIILRVARLTNVAKLLENGELSARTGLSDTGGELGELARSFDAMALSLSNRETELRESEEAFRKLFEESSNPILLMRGNQFIDCNQSTLNFLGITDKHVFLHSTPEDISPERQPDGTLSSESAMKYITAAHRDGICRFEWMCVRHDGSPFLLEVVLMPMTIKGQKLLHITWFDITEQKRTAEQLLKAKESAEAANRAKSEFLANMSHEIRTPLNGLLSMLHLLSVGKLESEQSEFVRIAIRSGHRLNSLLGDILDLSRIESDKLVLTPAPFSIPHLIQTIQETFGPVCHEKNVRLTMACGPEVPACLIGDEVRLRQVLFNLVGNATKFTDQGEICMQVEALPAASPEVVNLLFRIADTGIGIPEDKIDQIFEAFYQAETTHARKFQGAGLGLSIVRHLLELMGGTVSVENTGEHGTAFEFVVPFQRGEMGCENAEQNSKHKNISYLPQSLRILLVEDERINRFGMRRILQQMGHAVIEACDGQEALKVLKTEDIDCILMDIQMPVMDGIEATRIIRSSPELKDKSTIPIIALTAYAMSGDKENLITAGVDDYIAKPVDFEELERAIGRTWQGRNGR